jgi:riboflavin biosynthesis pyrimidine reductase
MLDRDEIVTRYAVADRTVPRLRVNFIASLDGAATHDGVSGPLNDEVDQFVFGALRMLADVVVVGAGTVRGEGYGAMVLDDDAVEWRLAHGLPEHPRFAIVTSRVDLEPDSSIFTRAPVRPIVVTHAGPAARPPVAPGVDLPRTPGPGSGAGPATAVDADAALRTARIAAIAEVADVIECGDTAVDGSLMAAELVARGLPQILCEGGPHLLGALIEADAVDELCLTLAPVLEGGAATRIASGGAQVTREMRLAHAFAEGDMLFLRHVRAR